MYMYKNVCIYMCVHVYICVCIYADMRRSQLKHLFWLFLKLKGREGEDVDALPHTDRIGQKYSTKMGSAPFEATPGLPAPPRVHHADVSTSTSDPNYDK